MSAAQASQVSVTAARANKHRGRLQLFGRGLLDTLLKGFLVPHQTSRKEIREQLAMLSVNVGRGAVLNLESAGQEMYPGSDTLRLRHENRGFAER